MNYQYRVRDPLGNAHEGEIEAPNVDDATQQLKRDGFQVLEIDEDDGSSLIPKRVSKNDIIYVTNQLAIMVDTGITLSTALEGIVEEEQNPTLRKVLTDLRDSVAGGEDFSSALSRYPKMFDKTYVALVRASEATGTLGPMLDRIAGYLRKEVETRGKVRAAMAYPAVMLVLAIGVTIFLLTYILPKFTPLFKSKGQDIPGITAAMMSVSDAILVYWWAWLAGLAATVGLAVFLKRTGPGRQVLDWVKINAPIIGPVSRKVTISRSIRTLGTMLAAGVPVMDSLKLAAQVSGNIHYEALWRRVLDEVTSGRRMAEALRGDPLFPRVLVQMIHAGEETGKLDMVLQKVSTYYDGEVETSIKAATSMIEPLMIAAMGVVVGTIGLALLLPIFSLSKQP